jgi:hypothetical protein
MWSGKSRLMRLGTRTFATAMPAEKIPVPANRAAIGPCDRRAIPAAISARHHTKDFSMPTCLPKCANRGEARKDQQRQRRQQSHRRIRQAEARSDRLEERTDAGECRRRFATRKKKANRPQLTLKDCGAVAGITVNAPRPPATKEMAMVSRSTHRLRPETAQLASPPKTLETPSRCHCC